MSWQRLLRRIAGLPLPAPPEPAPAPRPPPPEAMPFNRWHFYPTSCSVGEYPKQDTWHGSPVTILLLDKDGRPWQGEPERVGKWVGTNAEGFDVFQATYQMQGTELPATVISLWCGREVFRQEQLASRTSVPPWPGSTLTVQCPIKVDIAKSTIT